jgi:hypothetical protein
MVECGAYPGQCDQETICPVRVNWNRINGVVERALELVPISEMLGDETNELLEIGGDAEERETRCKTN